MSSRKSGTTGLRTAVKTLKPMKPLPLRPGNVCVQTRPATATVFDKIIEAHRLVFNIEATLDKMRSEITGEGEAEETVKASSTTIDSSAARLVDRLNEVNDKLFRLSKSIGEYPSLTGTEKQVGHIPHVQPRINGRGELGNV